MGQWDSVTLNASRNSRRILSWFKDDVFRRLFLNAGKILSANGIATILGLVATALTARALGPENYGILALVLAYEATIGKLVTFNAWQAIIKFGSDALHAGDSIGFGQLLKFGFILDIGSAVVGTALAMGLASPVIALIGWDQSVRPLLVLYSVLILFNLSGTPIGVLRLFDRFDLLSYTPVLSVLLKLGGILWCVATTQSLYGFVWVYLVTGIVAMLYQLCASLWVLRKNGIGNFFFYSLRGLRTRFPGIWDYVWTTNLNATIRMLSREADGLIIAGLTTPTGLGLFRVAKQFSAILPMISDPLSQAIFPELARLWSQKEKCKFLSLIKRATFFTSIAGLSGWIVFVLLGKWIITFIFGESFQGAYFVTVVYMFALVVFLVFFTVVPSMLAIGLARQVFLTIVVGTLVYFALLFILVPSIGIVGAALAYIAFFVSSYVVAIFYLFPYLRSTEDRSCP